MDYRLLVPASLRKETLGTLYSAYQCISSMSGRACQSNYWQGLSTGIYNARYTHRSCNEEAPG